MVSGCLCIQAGHAVRTVAFLTRSFFHLDVDEDLKDFMAPAFCISTIMTHDLRLGKTSLFM
jgi:hypothetical protein